MRCCWRGCANDAPGPIIVYVTLQRTAERVASRHGAAPGCRPKAYHAGNGR